MAITKEQIAEATKKVFEDANIGREDVDDAVDKISLEDIPKEETVYPMPIDYYQRGQDMIRAEAKKSYPRGASTLTKKIAEEALNGLAKQKRRVEADSNYWKERGDKERAQMVKDQYMEECFLPAVEMVIIASTPDEVLNAKDILKGFDDQTFEFGPGYTASYIRTAYGDQLGNASNRSDGYVRDQVQRLHYLASSDQIRAAYGLAKKLKEEIDKGEHTADDDDYDVIMRVATID